jgi:adenylate cyclase, class 2
MERKRIEIEAKFPLKNMEYTINRLKEVGIQTEKNKFQKDIYFTPAHENFIEKIPISEWLRVRDDGEEQTINYKNWSNLTGNNKITCKEIEVGIDDYNGMLEILKMLDFKEIIVVEKTRNSFEYNDIIFSIDTIKDLGNFIELEFKTNKFEIEEKSLEYIKDNLNTLKIEVGNQIFAGYPQLVMENEKSTDNN